MVIAGISGALLAWAASRFLVEARRTGELELLLTTPFGAEALVAAQWDVLKRLLRWPVVVMLMPILLQGISAYLSRQAYSVPNWWQIYTQCSLLLVAINTVLGVGALCWLGMWFGLQTGSQMRAILWTVALVRGTPYAL